MAVRPMRVVMLGLVLAGAVGCGTTGSISAPSTSSAVAPTSDPSGDGATTTVLDRSTTAPDRSTTAPTPATEPPATTAGTSPTPDPLDWDGTHYDFGNVIQATAKGSSVEIAFDRYQIYGGDHWIQASEIDSEPLIYANTDVPYLNDSPKLRAFRLASDVDIEVLANLRAICDGMFADVPIEVAPTYRKVSTAELVSWSSAGADLAPPGFVSAGQEALTFDERGNVIRLVFLDSC